MNIIGFNMIAAIINPNPCCIASLNSPNNLAFRQHHRMKLLHRLLPQLMDVLDAQQLTDTSRDLELLYWPVLGHSRSPCFFEVPAFLGSVKPDQPMEPALVVEHLMAEPCPPLPKNVAPAACNLERLRKHLDLSLAQSLRLLCAYLNYGGAAWPCFELPAPALRALLAAWWRVDLDAVDAEPDDRLRLIGLLEQPDSCGSISEPNSLATSLSVSATVVQALSLSHATDAELFDALQLTA